MKDDEVRTRVERLESLLEEVEAFPPAVEAMGALVELYGEALARLMRGADPEQDELVSHLLLLHGLHPKGTEERVASAVDSMAPRLQPHGGNVELMAIEGSVVRLRLGGLEGCASTRASLRREVEATVLDAAPEILRVEVDEPARETALVQIEMPRAGNGSG